MTRVLLFFLTFCTTVLNAQYTLEGEVRNTSGVALTDMNVFLPEHDLGDETDKNGRFIIDNIPGGLCTIIIQGIGFERVELKARAEDFGSFKTFTLKEKSYDLQEAEVISTWAREDTPVTFKELAGEELQSENLGYDVPFVLRWTPSVVVTSDAGTGIGYTGIRIRGTDQTRINVTINGIPLNDSESQGVFWVDLPDFLSSADQIQIQRGVGTSTHGSGAFGATINLSTLKAETKPYGKVGGSIGSFNTRKANVAFGTGLLNDHFIMEGRLSQINSDGFIDRSGADLSSFYLSTNYLTEKFSFNLLGFHGHEVTNQAWFGVPAQYLDDDELRTYNPAGEKTDGSFHENQVDDYQQTHVQAHLKSTLTPELLASLSLNYTRGKGFFEEYIDDGILAAYGLDDIDQGNQVIRSTDLIRRRWLDNDYYVATFSLEWNPAGKPFQVITGGAASQYKGDHFGEVIWARYASNGEINHRYYENTGDKTDYNIYSKLNYRFSPSTNAYLDLQFRRVDYTYEGRDNDASLLDQSIDHHFFNPKIGINHNWSSGWTSYFSFGVANREPNRQDFIDSSENSRPDPERLYNAELGVRKSQEQYSIGINAYYMRYKDQLVLTGQLNDVGEVTRVNVDDSYRLGVEVDGRWESKSGLFVEGNFTLSRNTIDLFMEGIDNWDAEEQELVVHENTDLSFSPNVISALELGYEFMKNQDDRDLELSVQHKFVGDQFIDNTSSEFSRLDAYHFTNFRANFSINDLFFDQIKIRFQVNNVFDQMFSSNAWIYRFISPSFDPVPFNAYATSETGDTYNLSGYFPQAGRNYLLGLEITF